MMNRKKALLIISLIEFMLVAVATFLFMDGVLGLTAFLTLIIAVATVTSTVILFAVRRLPQE